MLKCPSPTRRTTLIAGAMIGSNGSSIGSPEMPTIASNGVKPFSISNGHTGGKGVSVGGTRGTTNVNNGGDGSAATVAAVVAAEAAVVQRTTIPSVVSSKEVTVSPSSSKVHRKVLRFPSKRYPGKVLPGKLASVSNKFTAVSNRANQLSRKQTLSVRTPPSGNCDTKPNGTLMPAFNHPVPGGTVNNSAKRHSHHQHRNGVYNHSHLTAVERRPYGEGGLVVPPTPPTHHSHQGNGDTLPNNCSIMLSSVSSSPRSSLVATVTLPTTGSSPVSDLSAASSVCSVASVAPSAAVPPTIIANSNSSSSGINSNSSSSNASSVTHQPTTISPVSSSPPVVLSTAAGITSLTGTSNRDGKVQLQIVTQPEQQHRARYQTEGSRGAVKDRSGNGFPVVRLVGYNKPTVLQVFIGTDVGRPSPHIFYQACRVAGKNSTACIERKLDGTTVIELQLKPENGMSVTCDCVGILKERNVDVEHRFPDQITSRTKKKSTRCRMVFRTVLNADDGRSEILQVASQPIVCTQPPGVPEICKRSFTNCTVTGGEELYILGKNFLKDTRVVFQRRKALGVTPWEQSIVPNKEYMQPAHLVCVVPPYDQQEILEPALVKMYIVSGGRKSEVHDFVYLPKGMCACNIRQQHRGGVLSLAKLQQPHQQQHEQQQQQNQHNFFSMLASAVAATGGGGSLPDCTATTNNINTGATGNRHFALNSNEVKYEEESNHELQAMYMHNTSTSMFTEEGMMPPPINILPTVAPVVGTGLRRPSLVIDQQQQQQQASSFTGTSPQSFKPELPDECSQGSLEDDSLDRFPGSADNSRDDLAVGSQLSTILYRRRSVRQPSMDITEDSSSNISLLTPETHLLEMSGLTISNDGDSVIGSILQHTHDVLLQQQQQQQQQVSANAVDVAIAAAAAAQLLPPGVPIVSMEQSSAHNEDAKKAVQDFILNAAAEILTAQETSLATQKTIDTLISMSTPELVSVGTTCPPALQTVGSHFVTPTMDKQQQQQQEHQQQMQQQQLHDQQQLHEQQQRHCGVFNSILHELNHHSPHPQTADLMLLQQQQHQQQHQQCIDQHVQQQQEAVSHAQAQQVVAQALVTAQPLPEKMEIGMPLTSNQSVPQTQPQQLPPPQPQQQPMDTSAAPVTMSSGNIDDAMILPTLGALGASNQSVVDQSLVDESRDLTGMTDNELIHFICPNAFDSM